MPNDSSVSADVKDAVWRQFGAAIDMLANAINACPEGLWNDTSRAPQYWYVVYHTLFFLDFYLADGADEFQPPPPFTLSEREPDVMPDRVYTREELMAYLRHGRRRCQERIARLTRADVEEQRQLVPFHGTLFELLFYNMRHVQHHTGQLNLLLRQATGQDAPRWVSQARPHAPASSTGPA